jgi:hypothetical protein
MDAMDTRRHKRVQEKLVTIFEALVEDYGMESDDVGLFMMKAADAVAGPDGNVYMDTVIREIEERIGKRLFEDRSLVH